MLHSCHSSQVLRIRREAVHLLATDDSQSATLITSMPRTMMCQRQALDR
jgi:hypothetical protein